MFMHMLICHPKEQKIRVLLPRGAQKIRLATNSDRVGGKVKTALFLPKNFGGMGGGWGGGGGGRSHEMKMVTFLHQRWEKVFVP